jgi:hypothetical protein
VKPEVKPDAVVERMVFLARQLGQTADEKRERQFLAALPERAADRRNRDLRRRRFSAAVVLAAACLGPLFWLTRHGENRLSYRVSDGSLGEGNIVGQQHTSVAFSDGSRLQLGNGALARIREVTAHGAQVDLVEGEVSVDIVKAEGNAWSVQAGPYVVHVIGTAFDVRWHNAQRRIEVDLHRGSVTVTGPHIDGQLRLQSGQRLVSVPDAPSVVAPIHPPTAPATANSSDAPKNPPDAGELEPAADLSVGALEHRDPTATGPANWSRLVAQGDFERVLAAAERRGIDNVLSAGNQSELAALADAARYGRKTQLARRALLAERKRFPGAAAARGAAFFLGGIEADGSAAALSWYETYLAESPTGPYAAQALGRRMMIVHRRDGIAASASLARDYLKRFAQGPYASAAHKILERSSE